MSFGRVLLGATMALLLGFASEARAGDAAVTVIHGIPGLPAEVDVLVNGDYLFSFDYPEQVPATLPAGTYALEVQLEGATVLSASATVEAGKNYSIIAHQTFIDGDASGIALSVFVNDIAKLKRGKAGLTVRHTADAPAVDIALEKKNGKTVLFVEDLENPDDGQPSQAGRVEVTPRRYTVEIFPAGGDEAVFVQKLPKLKAGFAYIAYATGSVFDSNFGLIIQVIDLRDRKARQNRDDDDDDGGDDDNDD